MGRTNGKLKTFLMDGLQNNSFPNLNWEDQNAGIFSLKLPRYEKRKDLDDFEKILIHWYITNNRNYPGYSGAKAVIQAALKKSVYLVCLNTNSNELRFRFATTAEEQEKRMKQKQDSFHKEPSHESSHLDLGSINREVSVLYGLGSQFFPMPSPSPPLSLPSISSPQPPPPPLSPSSPSSGYQSGSPSPSNCSEDEDLLKALEDLLQNPESYVNALDDFTKDIEMETVPNSIEENISPQDDTELKGVEFNPVPVQFPEKPVVELVATDVKPLQKFLPWYWLCTKKLHLDSTLLLICEKQDIQDESQGISPGEIHLNNVLEPGMSYSLEKKLEFDGKCFLFLLRND